MSSTQHQLIEQCATRLRGIVEALDNIHDTSPHRWSTDLDDVHSSAESLLAMIKDQAPTQAAQGLAGAALAQPSPAQAEQAEAEQAEAERPEMSPERAAYFMRRFKSEEKLLGPNEQAAVDYVLSLLAQHESIVGALRAELESERNRVNIYVNNNGIRQDNERLRAELRAALARVAELDKQCRDDVARALGLRPSQERGFAWSYLLASIKSCVKASEDAAQAQHSVPEVSGIGRDFAYPRSVVLYLRTEPTDDDLRAIHDGLRSLAAAPGKEGV
ncbi:hypothetical protein [Pseudomonas aeruginosa]|uniref:hypothetical protein n=1 Tax=Pseudomonas aeruginosa TaxID=287 RepID=UPI00044DB865|nr:hypothetical protein [Pseudomonas aeruginosa]EZO20998.1 hypothetical protein AJ62_04513 [Pseudomonas aeruginosa 3575]